MRTQRTLLYLSLLLTALILTSCESLSSKEKRLNKLSAIEEKRKHFQTLYNDISTEVIRAGISIAEIAGKYGKPDDVFRSGSSTGQFEIWTYERVLTSKEVDWQPIRLYFNSGQLVSWSY